MFSLLLLIPWKSDISLKEWYFIMMVAIIIEICMAILFILNYNFMLSLTRGLNTHRLCIRLYVRVPSCITYMVNPET